MSKYTTGAILSPPDARDYTLAATAITYSSSFLLPRLPVVRQQGTVGSCCAHTGAEAGECYEGVKLSTDFPHGYRPLDYYQGEGLPVRDLLRTLLHVGNVPHADLPTNTAMPTVKDKIMSMTDKLIPKAAQYKIERYAQIYTIDEAKTALCSGMPVILVTLVYADFKATKDGVFTNTAASGLRSAHAMLVVGWDDKKGFRVQNSWGTNWGDKGYCWLPYEHITSGVHVKELWAVADTYRAELINRTLRKGHKGEDVKILQTTLTNRSYPCGSIDGIFGDKTYTAVVKFQKDNKLVVDGLVGVKTRAALGI